MMNASHDKNKTPTNKEEKFLFNVNIFDDGFGKDDEEELPTFSEEELESARKQGFEAGKTAGIKETQASQQQSIALSLQTLNQQFGLLLAEEEKREKVFEQEVISSVQTLFKKLFPVFEEKLGMQELHAVLEKIIQNQFSQKEILVQCPPALESGINETLAKLSTMGLNMIFTVRGNENLKGHACTLNWADGGAFIDRNALSEEIFKSLEQILAAQPSNRHDNETNKGETP